MTPQSFKLQNNNLILYWCQILVFWQYIYFFIQNNTYVSVRVMNRKISLLAHVLNKNLITLTSGFFYEMYGISMKEAYSLKYVLLSLFAGTFSLVSSTSYVHPEGWKNLISIKIHSKEISFGLFEKFLHLKRYFYYISHLYDKEKVFASIT